MTLDVRYVGTLARKQAYTSFNLNAANFRSNGLKDAFDVVRAGGESELLNSIFAGQTVNGQVFNGTKAGARCGRVPPSRIIWPTATMWVWRAP
jgi:hypothetical protein